MSAPPRPPPAGGAPYAAGPVPNTAGGQGYPFPPPGAATGGPGAPGARPGPPFAGGPGGGVNTSNSMPGYGSPLNPGSPRIGGPPQNFAPGSGASSTAAYGRPPLPPFAGGPTAAPGMNQPPTAAPLQPPAAAAVASSSSSPAMVRPPMSSPLTRPPIGPLHSAGPMQQQFPPWHGSAAAPGTAPSPASPAPSSSAPLPQVQVNSTPYPTGITSQAQSLMSPAIGVPGSPSFLHASATLGGGFSPMASGIASVPNSPLINVTGPGPAAKRRPAYPADMASMYGQATAPTDPSAAAAGAAASASVPGGVNSSGNNNNNNPYNFVPAQASPGIGSGHAPNMLHPVNTSGYLAKPNFVSPNTPISPSPLKPAGDPSGYQPNLGAMAAINNSFGGMTLSQRVAPVTVSLTQGSPLVNDLEKSVPIPRIGAEFVYTGSPTANSSILFARSTLNAIPQTSALLAKTKIPFGLLLDPFRTPLAHEAPIPVIDDNVIVRCRRCRTYINPFVSFIDNGTRWTCNVCYSVNEVPAEFDFNIETNSHVDRRKRAELNHGVVEYIAPREYTVRAPVPPVYFFIFDVSHASVSSGLLAVAAKTLLDSLDRLIEQDKRTRIGFITVDSTLHFYVLDSELSEPKMLVVPELDDVFLPVPEDLLVTLAESKAVVKAFLEKLGDMFKNTVDNRNALGPALKAAIKLIEPIGGRICVLQSVMPDLGVGALRHREDIKALGTSKESDFLRADGPNDFYKTLAVECSKHQIGIDTWFFNAKYFDIATISSAPRFTGGDIFYYPTFNASVPEDAMKFGSEFHHYLNRPCGFEGVMRIRASRGLKMTSYHGNFFIRSADLLALPNISPDNSYAVQLEIEETIQTSFVCIQTALLYTTNFSERRIRVVTTCIPVTTDIGEVIACVDQSALAILLAKMAVERALTKRIEDARDAIVNKLVDICGVYKASFCPSVPAGQLLLADNLKLLPLLLAGLLRHVSLRGGSQTPSDLRSAVIAWVQTVSVEHGLPALIPHLYSLHDMHESCGLPGEDGSIVLPYRLNATAASIQKHGLYLLDDGHALHLWVGKYANQEMCMALFDLPGHDALPVGKYTLPALNNLFSQRVNSIVGKIRENRRSHLYLYLVKDEGEAYFKYQFLSQLIEDKWGDNTPSYPQFLKIVIDKVGSQ